MTGPLARLGAAGLGNGRQPAIGGTGIVVSPDPFATLTGIDVLRSGGNAVDAALAVSAALMVALPHQCGPGGDAFWIIRSPQGETRLLNASGRSSRHASAEALRAQGLRLISERDAVAITAPGVMAGWAEVHRTFATRELEALVTPAIRAAEDGLIISPYFERQLATYDAILARRPAVAAVFRPRGRRMRAGERHVQADLGRTLRALAIDPRALYGDDLARRIGSCVRSEGGVLDAEDLATTTATWDQPLAGAFHGWEVLEAPPNSQGMAALVGLAIREQAGSALRPTDAVGRTHLWVESARLAIAVRDAVVADPEAMRFAPASVLVAPVIARLAEAISPASAMPRERLLRVVETAMAGIEGDPDGASRPRGRAGAGSDTAHFVVVDRDGMAVSCIQSLFSAFGTAILVPGTGLLLHSRGAGFTLEQGHPNELGPRQRPMHTLAPAMATAGPDLAAVFGCMGGHAQTQVHLQMLESLLELGLDPAATTARPRWFARPDPATGREELLVESRHRAAAALASLGHPVRRVGPYDEIVGHEQIVVVDRARGALVGAADPRSNGLALAC